MGRRPQTWDMGFKREGLEPLHRGAENPIPEDPTLLRAVVATLLFKLEKVSLAEGRSTRASIQYIAGLERSESLAPEAREKCYEIALNMVRSGKPPRGRHLIPMILVQRRLLQAYFEQNQYPLKSDRPQDEWIMEQEEGILHLIRPFPCLCKYKETLNGFAQAYLKDYRELTLPDKKSADGKYHLTLADAIDTVIGHLHGCNAGYIRKLKKPSARPPRR